MECEANGTWVAEVSDEVADKRDEAADQRDRAGDQRDRAAHERDLAAEQRDLAAEQYATPVGAGTTSETLNHSALMGPAAKPPSTGPTLSRIVTSP